MSVISPYQLIKMVELINRYGCSYKYKLSYMHELYIGSRITCVFTTAVVALPENNGGGGGSTSSGWSSGRGAVMVVSVVVVRGRGRGCS